MHALSSRRLVLFIIWLLCQTQASRGDCAIGTSQLSRLSPGLFEAAAIVNGEAKKISIFHGNKDYGMNDSLWTTQVTIAPTSGPVKMVFSATTSPVVLRWRIECRGQIVWSSATSNGNLNAAFSKDEVEKLSRLRMKEHFDAAEKMVGAMDAIGIKEKNDLSSLGVVISNWMTWVSAMSTEVISNDVSFILTDTPSPNGTGMYNRLHCYLHALSTSNWTSLLAQGDKSLHESISAWGLTKSNWAPLRIRDYNGAAVVRVRSVTRRRYGDHQFINITYTRTHQTAPRSSLMYIEHQLLKEAGDDVLITCEPAATLLNQEFFAAGLKVPLFDEMGLFSNLVARLRQKTSFPVEYFSIPE